MAAWGEKRRSSSHAPLAIANVRLYPASCRQANLRACEHSSGRNPFQPLTHQALNRVGFYRVLCSPSYCSAPQMWQTDAHRLMRDRHLRHILNRLRHHRNEEASAVKMKRMMFWSIASHLFFGLRNVVNDEQWQPAGPNFCLARVPRRADSCNSRTAIDDPQPYVAAQLSQHDSQVACTSGTISCEVFGHLAI